MKSLLFLLLLNPALSTPKKSPDCRSLHEGKFKVSHSQSGTTIITRTKDIQIEENVDYGVKMSFDIKWIDDCTYELRPKKMISGDPAFMGPAGSYLTVHIKDIKDNTYTAVTSSSDTPEVMEFTVDVIK